LAGKEEISAAHRGLGELVVVLAAIGVVLALALAIARQEFPTEAAVAIAWAIVVSATPLRWVTAADLAAGRAAIAGAVLVPAPVAAHPAWAAVGADLVAAACAVVVVCAAVGGAGGKHHEHSKSDRELGNFEFVLAKTFPSRCDSNSAAHPGADLRISRRRADNKGGDS
jgi:hypothetical protein